MAKGEATLSYDRAENIVHMSFPTPVELSTRLEIAEHFDRVIAFWRVHARGQKSYFVVNFDNVQINVDELDFYAEQTRRAHEVCALTSVRYGGSATQRTLTRLAGIKIHRPSNLYGTRAEALAVVRALKKGEILERPALRARP